MTFPSSNGAEQAHTGQTAPQARVFVGLKIAPELTTQLAQIAKTLEKQAVRPIAPADIHLTRVPPWNETSIIDAVAKLSRVAERFGAFRLTFQHVGYGPQSRRSRLLWAECAATDEIAALRAALLQACGQTDARPFQPHVTLARIRAAGPAIARKYPIDQSLSLTRTSRLRRALSIAPVWRNRLSGPRHGRAHGDAGRGGGIFRVGCWSPRR